MDLVPELRGREPDFTKSKGNVYAQRIIALDVSAPSSISYENALNVFPRTQKTHLKCTFAKRNAYFPPNCLLRAQFVYADLRKMRASVVV